MRDTSGSGAPKATDPATNNAPTTLGTVPPQQLGQPQDQQTPQPQQPKASYFQSPALVSDAVRRLGLAAMDRTVAPIDPRQPGTEVNILRAMTNLLTLPQRKWRRDSDYAARGHHPYSTEDSASMAGQSRYAALSAFKRSTMYLSSTRHFTGADQSVADDYVFSMALSGDDPSTGANRLSEVCERNAVAARKHGRYDHERVFKTLRTLFVDDDEGTDEKGDRDSLSRFASDTLAAKVIKRL